MEDKKIIELFCNRSEQAIAELSKKYERLCYKVAHNVLGNSLDAEECVNDTYLGVWDSIPPHIPDTLKAYVCRIVRNLSIKKYHANTAVKRNSYYDIALEELAECIPSMNTIDRECDSKEAAEVIDRFLDTLDKENRIMFMRRYWFSDSISEISEMFHLSEHNVSARLYRTRKRMKKYLMREGVWL